MTVVFGMPLLAIPLGWDAPASGRRPAAPLGHSSSASTWENEAVETDGEEGNAGERPADSSSHVTSLERGAAGAVSQRKRSGWGNSSRAHPRGKWGDSPESVELAQLALSLSLQQRLEELGAEYLVVERLEVSGLYRCVCLVDVPGTAYQRPFEAADILPERAVHRVLEELATWRLAMIGLETRNPEN
jgi:hypothetical protein